MLIFKWLCLHRVTNFPLIIPFIVDAGCLHSSVDYLVHLFLYLFVLVHWGRGEGILKFIIIKGVWKGVRRWGKGGEREEGVLREGF